MGFVFITWCVQSVQKIIWNQGWHIGKMTFIGISDGIDASVGVDVGVVGVRTYTIDPWVEQAIHIDQCADAVDDQQVTA